MKNYHLKWLLAILMLFAAFDLFSQESASQTKDNADRPFQFSKFAARSDCRTADLQKLFTHNISDKVIFPIGENQQITGIVIGKIVNNNGLTTMNIRAENFPGAILNLSLYKAANGEQHMGGMIMNPKSSDVLIITEENNKYVIKKELQRLFMAECSL